MRLIRWNTNTPFHYRSMCSLKRGSACAAQHHCRLDLPKKFVSCTQIQPRGIEPGKAGSVPALHALLGSPCYPVVRHHSRSLRAVLGAVNKERPLSLAFFSEFSLSASKRLHDSLTLVVCTTSVWEACRRHVQDTVHILFHALRSGLLGCMQSERCSVTTCAG
jgi:hypothetical protein